MSYVAALPTRKADVLVDISKKAEGAKRLVHLVTKEGRVACRCNLSPTGIFMVPDIEIEAAAIDNLCPDSRNAWHIKKEVFVK